MNIALREPWTVDRFLAWEDKQEGRHEFDGVRIVQVTGGTRAHQRIVSNLVRLLEDALDPDRFDAVPEMRLEVGGRIRYPDVSVVAGRVPDTEQTLHDAVVLFEVVSEDSAGIDRKEKRDDYAGVPGIRHYAIIEQTRAAVTLLARTTQGWEETETTTELNLPEIGVVLPMTAIYRGVRFAV